MTAYDPNFHLAAIRAVQIVSACHDCKIAMANGGTVLILRNGKVTDLLDPSNEQDWQVLDLLSTSEVFQNKLSGVICSAAKRLGELSPRDYCLVTRRGTLTWANKDGLAYAADCIEEGPDELR